MGLGQGEVYNFEYELNFYFPSKESQCQNKYSLFVSGPHPPPPPLECMRGPHAYSNFVGGRGYFLAVVSGRFPEKTWKRGCFFVIANGNQYPR